MKELGRRAEASQGKRPSFQQLQEAQRTPHTVLQAQPTVPEALTALLIHSHVPHQAHLGQPLQLHQQ